MIACLSPNGRTETVADHNADTLLVGTLRGIYALTRHGTGAWSAALRGLEQSHISCLLHEPRSGLLFAGLHGRGEKGGLFVSKDQGITWSPCMNGLEYKHVYTIAAQSRGDKTVLYAGTEPAALFRSDDLGASWRDVASLRDVPDTDKWTFPPPPHIAHVKNVAFHPDEPDTLYVCVEQGAVLKTVDDGKTWRELSSYASEKDSFYHDVHRVAINRQNSQRVHLATGDGLYYSEDGGENWQHQQGRDGRVGYPDALFLDPHQSDVVYVGGAGDAPETWRVQGGAHPGFIVSRDRGKHWQELMNGLPSSIHGNIEAMGMHSWPGGLAFFAGTAVGDVFATEDGGANWKLIATGLPPISKARHYRHFLSAEEKLKLEEEARAERRAEGLADREYITNA